MPASLASERATVQNPLVAYATEIGWQYLPRETALTLRRGTAGTLLYPLLRDRLVALKPGAVGGGAAEQNIPRLDAVPANIGGNAEVLAWLRGERSLFVEADKQQRNVTVIDFDHAANNTFHVTDEWEYTSGLYTNRADVIFLINGVPVAVVETKAAARREAVDEGLTQIRRYHRETP